MPQYRRHHSCAADHSLARRARTLAFTLLLLALIGLGAPNQAFANEGVFTLGNDALQLGRAGSGIASPRSAYWSYLNPASMVDLEGRVDASWYTVITDISLEPKGLMGNRCAGEMDSSNIFNIVSSGVVIPTSKGTFGGGLYIPSGTGAEYDVSRTYLSRLWNADRRLYYQHLRLVAAYGYEFDNGWAVGLGLHGSLSRFTTDHITLKLLPTKGDFEWDEALGGGFNLSVYKAWEKWAFGATYTSRHWTENFDKYDDLLRYPLDQPQIVQVGLAYKVNDKLELTGDLKWLNWKDVKAYGGKVMDGGFNWDDQYGFKLGAEYILNEKWILMAGFAHSNTPIDEDHVMVAGLVPVTVEDHITAGCSYAINEKHQVHLSAIYALNNTLTDSGKGSADPFSWIGKGTKLSSAGISAALGYTYLF